MKSLFAWLCAVLALIGLNACDAIKLHQLEPGVSTAAEVREHFGPPHMEWNNDDGSLTWEYSRQPQGIECFMITIGPDQILRSIEQVLQEEYFARIRPGMSGDEVRRVLGKPARSQFFRLKNETIWEWRISQGTSSSGDPEYFTVSFNTDGRVITTGRHVEYRQ